MILIAKRLRWNIDLRQILFPPRHQFIWNFAVEKASKLWNVYLSLCVFIVPTRNDCERFNTFLISLYIFVVEKFDWHRLTLKKPNQKVSRCENSNRACVCLCRCHCHRSRCRCCCCWQAQNSQYIYCVGFTDTITLWLRGSVMMRVRWQFLKRHSHINWGYEVKMAVGKMRRRVM